MSGRAAVPAPCATFRQFSQGTVAQRARRKDRKSNNKTLPRQGLIEQPPRFTLALTEAQRCLTCGTCVQNYYRHREGLSVELCGRTLAHLHIPKGRQAAYRGK